MMEGENRCVFLVNPRRIISRFEKKVILQGIVSGTSWIWKAHNAKASSILFLRAWRSTPVKDIFIWP
jgi:hypothetical protein